MGSLYRPKYRGLGGTLNQSAVIWLRYRDSLGVLRHESSESDKEQRARRLLKATRGRRGSRGSIGPTRSWTRRCRQACCASKAKCWAKRGHGDRAAVVEGLEKTGGQGRD